LKKEWRKTKQYLLPDLKPFQSERTYDIYPSFKLEDNQISVGFESIAEVMMKHKIVVIDGYTGVFYDQLSEKLDKYFKIAGKKTSWNNTSALLKHPDIIEEIVSPFTKDFLDINLLKE
jgi:hypothetical protein